MKKVIELMKEILGGKISTKVFGLRAKTYSFLIDDGNEDKKKSKIHKKVCHKKNFENKINHTEENKENHKEFIKNNNSILKTQQRFIS